MTVGTPGSGPPAGGKRSDMVAHRPADQGAVADHVDPRGPLVAVLMPTMNQAAFLPRAVGSLLAQSVRSWQLVIVDDGSADETPAVARRLLTDPRVTYRRLAHNRGLGEALNVALDATTAPYVAYLPSDDVYYAGHLAALLRVLDDESVVLAWSGVRHHGALTARDAPEGHSLQLVQVMHRRVAQRWTPRSELESDDLERLYWSHVRKNGGSRGTGDVTCGWTDHPAQRHKQMRESCDGGLNVFRSRYRIPTPLRFQSADGDLVDEVALYARFRERPATSPAAGGLRILLVGELAHNPERVLALEEAGHQLFGLWTDEGLGDHTVGPLPFGHVTDLPRQGWRAAARTVRPDVVYALLNWRAVPLAHEVLGCGLGVPFVWHFKESPQACMRNGTWSELVDLVTGADAAVFSTPEELEWFELALPDRLGEGRTLVLDGDLPKAEWLDQPRSRRLSADTGEVHTVVLGRPLGMDARLVTVLAAAGIHIHFHGLVRGRGPTGTWLSWLQEARESAPGHVHVHPRVDQRDWVRVLSRYDAGWLHRFRSCNGGDLRRATWDDLNYPARLATYLAAGLPVIQQRSRGSTVAVDRLLDRCDVGVRYDDEQELAACLADRQTLQRLQENAWACRRDFTFDAHAEGVVELFRTVVDRP